MSGICGAIAWDGNPATTGWLEAMLGAAPYRGPASDRWIGDGVAIAAQRRPGMHSAFLATDDHSGLVVCLDGRIDNSHDLGARLGVDLAATSGAELLLAAVRHWGAEAAAHLVGDFAFAVWDRRAGQLRLARDVMGMRTLHIRLEPGRAIFATDISSLLSVMEGAPEIDERTIAHYLMGERVIDRRTAYAGIEQLLPGTWTTLDRTQATAHGAWTLEEQQPLRYRTELEYAEHFTELFERAVVDRIRPYRTVGIMLSGGLDSGAVAATAGHARRQGMIDDKTTITTLSWAFDDLTECDERHISRYIVDDYALSPIDVPADDAWPLRDYPAHGPDEAWPRVEVFQPLVDRTLEAAVAGGAETVLTGDRGDEVVGSWVFDHTGMLTRGAWRALRTDITAEKAASGSSTLRVAGRLIGRPAADRFTRRAPATPPIPPWVPEHLATHAAPGSAGDHGVARSRMDRILAPFTAARAAQLNLRCARFGLDYADPWSDRRLAEFVLTVPGHIVNRIAEPKRLAREAMRGIMPEPARVAARKIEPHALFDRGYRDCERSTLIDLTSGMQADARGLVDEEAVRREVTVYLAGGEPQHDWWRPVAVEMWLRAHWPAQRGSQ